MDRIVVKSREDMTRIANWVVKYIQDAHRDDMDEPVEFVPPFGHGELLFQDEPTTARFDYIGHGDVRFDVTTGKENLHIGSFVFNYSTSTVRDRQFDPKFVQVDRAVDIDNRLRYCQILGARWMAIMLLALYYRPEFERKRQLSASKQQKPRSSKKGKRAAKTIYTRQYILTEDFVEALPKPVRHHAKPQHEFSVKGHYRHYKSGKRVWINQHTRCKGRGDAIGNTYVAKIEEPKEN